MKERLQDNGVKTVLKEVNEYSMRFLLINTNDEIIYSYKRKLQKKMQWLLLEK